MELGTLLWSPIIVILYEITINKQQVFKKKLLHREQIHFWVTKY